MPKCNRCRNKAMKDRTLCYDCIMKNKVLNESYKMSVGRIFNTGETPKDRAEWRKYLSQFKKENDTKSGP